jgi:signal transduction histidine kinase/CheY-like chemotaxis protein
MPIPDDRSLTPLDSARIPMLMAVINGIADGIVVSDREGRFLIFNPAAERILRLGPIETSPEAWPRTYGIFLADRRTPHPVGDLPLMRAMRGETVREAELFIRHHDAPEGIWVSVNATPFRDDEGRVQGGIAVFRDVTERRRMEEELYEAKERAEEASRARGVFLATMSHEIRSPLHALLGMAHLLQRSELTVEQRELLNVIQHSGETLLSVIADALDYSRIEAGRVALETSPFALRDTIGRAARMLAQRAHEKGLELAFRVDPACPDGLVGDAGRLRQVLLNLLGNAIKFTDRGEIVLEVGVESDHGSTVCLAVTVRDTGLGIPPEKQEIIFESFEQGDRNTTRKYGGSGLGLAIARRFVELMGGRIGVESAPGHGSTFRFTARFEVNERGPERDPGSWHGRRALVVDPHATTRRFLLELLAEMGLTGTGAPGVREAGTRLSPPPDIVFLEAGLDLPEDEPFFRFLAAPGAPPVVLLFPSGRPIGELPRMSPPGVSQHLAKPVRASELEATLRDLAPGRRRTVPAPRVPGPRARHSGRPLRILLAEDSAANRTLAARILEGWGHRVRVAATGREAVEIAQSDPPDVILMDVEMPDLDGLEATRLLRRGEAEPGSRTPIYALTAHVTREERDRCQAAGMDGFIAKPIDLDRLQDALDRLAARTPRN